MVIDYKPKPFRLLFGDANFDATDYIDGFEIGTPDLEIGAQLTWTGTIELSQNRKAGRALPADAFSLYAHPERWRPDRRVTLELTASTGEVGRIALRLQRYGINNRVAKASVRQLADALDRDRPAADAEFIVGVGGSPYPEVIEKLLTMAFTGTGMNPTAIDASIAWGAIDDMISTRNPIPDVNHIASTCWQWLTHGPGESFKLISGDPLAHPVLFARAEGEFEIEPDTEKQNDWLSKSIVTGSYQQAVRAKEDCGDNRELDSLDDKGRPGAIRTTLQATFAEVFPDRSFAGVNILGHPVSSYDDVILQEEKVIIYRYGDDAGITIGNTRHDSIRGALFSAVFGTGIPNIVSVANQIPVIPVDLDNTSAVITVTVSIRFGGAIYPSLGTNVIRRCASIEIQSERVKRTFKPRGTIRAAYGADWKMVESPDETVDEQSASRPVVSAGRNKNAPANTPARCLEKPVKAEPRQTAPKWEMQTIPVRGECTIAPANWEPFIKLPLITDFGFLPSQAHADYLACQIAAKEVRKLDQWSVSMPIPDEWIRAGMPGYFRVHLHDAEYEATAVRVIYARNPTVAKLVFHALRIGAAPAVPRMTPNTPAISFDGSLQIALNVTSIDGISGQSLGPFYVSVAGGNI